MRTPDELDRKSLSLHRLVARKIRSDPALFDRVREALERSIANAAPSEMVYMIQWIKVFDCGIEETLAVTIEETERGQVLRSASPFAGVLDDHERQAFFREWSSGNGAPP